MTTLGRTIVYVDDVQETLAFYGKAFGLATRFAREAGYGELETGETALAFATFESGAHHLPEGYTCEAPTTRMSIEIAFVTDDVEAAFARAVEAGAEALREPEAKPWGQTVASLRTPEGTFVDLSSPLAVPEPPGPLPAADQQPT